MLVWEFLQAQDAAVSSQTLEEVGGTGINPFNYSLASRLDIEEQVAPL